MDIIEEVQKKAKEIGHCLCDLNQKCPCKEFMDTGNCRCSLLETKMIKNSPAELAKIPLKDDSEIRRVEIIMLKFKEPEVEIEALNHIIENTDHPFKLTIFDNRLNLPNTSRIWNALIRESNCDYICILDSDVFVSKKWLTRLMETFEKPDCYAVLPVTNKTSGKQHRAEKALSYPQEPILVNRIFAAQIVLYKKEIFNKIGYFDEEFYIYGQDSEWSHRLLKSEFNAYIRPDVWVEHMGSYSLNKAAKEGNYDKGLERKYSKMLFRQKTR